MTRMMALDIGEKRTGVALSDETGTIAFPYKTVKFDLNEFKKIISEKNVAKIIVGVPYNLKKEKTRQTEKIEKKIETLKNLKIPLELIDETYTSVMAENLLIESDMRRDKRRGNVDKIAAALILKTYIETKR